MRGTPGKGPHMAIQHDAPNIQVQPLIVHAPVLILGKFDGARDLCKRGALFKFRKDGCLQVVDKSNRFPHMFFGSCGLAAGVMGIDSHIKIQSFDLI